MKKTVGIIAVILALTAAAVAGIVLIKDENKSEESPSGSIAQNTEIQKSDVAAGLETESEIEGIEIESEIKEETETKEVGTTSAKTTEPEISSITSDTKTTTESVTVDESRKSVEKAMKAYKDELEKLNIYSVYVTDINKDDIPEIVCELDEMCGAFMMTYTEKAGLCKTDIHGHSSMTPEVYMSKENLLYIRDDGHNQGTSFYHNALIYKINENGFVKVAEITGDDPEDFDWEDEELIEEMDNKYDRIFADKIREVTGDKHFTVYSQVAVTEDVAGYLAKELRVDK